LKIRQLKNQLLKEERRRRKNNPRRRRLWQVLLVALLGLAGLAFLAWYQRDEIAAWRYRQAESLALRGDYGDAVERLENLAAGKPRRGLAPRSLLLAGKLLEFNLQQHQQALLVYLRVLRDFPEAPETLEAQRRAADIYRQRLRDYTSALTLLQNLLEAGGGDDDHIRYQIADCYFQLENYEQARIEFQTLQKNHPDSDLLPEVSYRIGMAYLLEAQPDQAAEAFRETVDLWPDNRFGLEAQFALARVQEQRGELRKALAELRKLKGRYPDSGVLEHRISQVKKRMAKKKKAI